MVDKENKMMLFVLDESLYQIIQGALKYTVETMEEAGGEFIEGASIGRESMTILTKQRATNEDNPALERIMALAQAEVEQGA